MKNKIAKAIREYAWVPSMALMIWTGASYVADFRNGLSDLRDAEVKLQSAQRQTREEQDKHDAKQDEAFLRFQQEINKDIRRIGNRLDKFCK